MMKRTHRFAGILKRLSPANWTWLSRSEKNNKFNLKNNKTTSMAKKTVITKVLGPDAQDGIIEFPQNRTLYADQFTDRPPVSDEDRQGFHPTSMKEVFEHYQPSKEGVALETEEGGAVYEDFAFKQIKDFDDEQLIAQSAVMSGAKDKIDAYNAVIRQLQKNKTLRNALKDAEAKGELKNALAALIAELDKAE